MLRGGVPRWLVGHGRRFAAVRGHCWDVANAYFHAVRIVRGVTRLLRRCVVCYSSPDGCGVTSFGCLFILALAMENILELPGVLVAVDVL